MNILFEESGGLKAGRLMSEADSSLQVETGTGRRLKIKRNQVLLRFERPGADELLPQAERAAAEHDIPFLYECAPEAEFTAEEFAREVFSAQPAAVEVAGLLLALQAAPIYFHRKGKGIFRKAPAEQLEAALAGLAKRQALAEAQAALEAEILGGGLPEDMARQAMALATRPDKNSIAHKALDAAARQLRTTPEALLLERGAIPSAYALHRARFVQEHFPSGTRASIGDDELLRLRAAKATLLEKLPRAAQPAYSLDDASTDEVDDAFSLEAIDEGWRVGVHIAAPGLLIEPDSALGRIARDRASTVYFPGDKITMLPPEAVALGSLDEGSWQPTVSLYLEMSPEGEVLRQFSRVEQVEIRQNIRHGDWEEALEAAIAANGSASAALPWEGLPVLHRLASALRRGREAVRGKPEPVGRQDLIFKVDWSDTPNAKELGDGRARVETRIRGGAVDLLVSEFMIATNVRWGETLALAQLPGLYRTQAFGRVRMQTGPGPHQGMGVSHYAWCSSPLRRYCDLLNQWQLLAALGHRRPLYKSGDAQLFADLAQFESRHERYNEFQSFMERYWSLRLLGEELQRGGEGWALTASDLAQSTPELAVITRQEGVARLRRFPVTVRVPTWNRLTPGTTVEVAPERFDALENVLEVRPIRVVEAVEPAAPIRLAVLGDPISHSRSPTIHRHFAEQLRLPVDYEAIAVPRMALAERLSDLHAQGYAGLNLTIPLKEEAYALAVSGGWPISDRAQRAQAVNTLVRTEAGWSADNTDGAGLVMALSLSLAAIDPPVGDRSVLLIGAGGAARGVLEPLRAAGFGPIWVTNRTRSRAEALAADFQLEPSAVVDWTALAEPSPSLFPGGHWPQVLINASAASLEGEALPMGEALYAHARVAFDMMYPKAPDASTPWLRAVAEAAPHVLTLHGLGMLVGQAAESFHLWTGQRPDPLQTLAALAEPSPPTEPSPTAPGTNDPA